MEYRILEVKVIGGNGLKNVNMFTKMDVYVVGSISSDPNSVQKTPVHKKGGSDPVWNHRFKFNVNESEIRLNQIGLLFRIVSNRALGDREIGRVYVPMKELNDNMITGKGNSGEVSGEQRFMTYRVQTMSGKFNGSLEFSYKFGEKINKIMDRKVHEPVMAYPVYPGSGAGQGSYPVQGPPPPVYPGYGPGQGSYPVQGPPPPVYPPPQGNGYGYGYQPQQQAPPPVYQQPGYGFGYPGQVKPKRSNGAGMGTALGVGAGLLGGFLLGEMVEDIADGGGMMDDGMFDW